VEKQHTNLTWDRLGAIFEAEGFPVSGVVDYATVQDEYQTHAERYRSWIAEGKQGEMGYLARGLDRRLNPQLVFPELKSVIAVLRPYSPHPVGDEQLRYARYLNGPDYHDSMKAGLERSMQSLSSSGQLPADFKYKICVDTSAVLERTWAKLAGLGWIGKNTLLIHPQLGSYVFIGVVFTNHEFGIKPECVKDYCGPCTRCLKSCPTEALESHSLDSKKCISYLTLEKRGAFQERYPLKGFVAGCDLCQEACPYNSKAVRYIAPVEKAAYLITDESVLLQESETGYQARVKGTALSRIKFPDFQRNLKTRLNEENK
jgi:epoxyqueuosine reductase